VVGEYPIFSVLRVIIHSFDLFPLFHFKKVDYSKTNRNIAGDKDFASGDAPYLVPNPADTYVKIEGIESTNITEVFLIDITGKKLKEIYNKNILDINDIPSGTYFVRVMNKSQKAYYLKLIKK